MKLYTTEIVTKDGCVWSGPKVPGISFEDAQNYCEANGLGYCTVTGEFIGEVDWDITFNQN